ncbi:MAG: NADH-quinone oxidoreductase subunit H, partial [Planctomycetota bacterium]
MSLLTSTLTDAAEAATETTLATVKGGNLFHDLLIQYSPSAIPGWALALGAVGVGISILIGLVSFIAMFSTWAERKVAGHIQCRYGPMYAGGWHGWAQPIADGVKLLMKEDMIPTGADRVLFVTAPAIVLGAIFGALVALPL